MLIRTPLNTRIVTSPFGQRSLAISDNFHDGEDHRASFLKVYAPADYCIVEKVRSQDMDVWGKYVIVYVPELRLTFIHAHLSETYVKEGDIVDMDTILGLTGNTGSSTGPHLHVGIYTCTFDDIFDVDPENKAKHKHSVDPAPYYDAIPKDIIGHWAYTDTIRALNSGLLKGRPDGTMGLDRPITLAEAITLVIRTED